ncbi:MAG: YjbF family lipoprotein [Rhodobacteraceae bacterium]|nr:YjbF family lipoprotein [Paracoccaceae bacterium]
MTDMFRRIPLFAVLCAGLAACSSNPEDSRLLKDYFQGADEAEPNAAFVAARDANAPTYIGSLQTQENAYTLFARQTTNAKGESTWVSPDNLSLGMTDGMIIATRGFGDDQMAADARQTLAALKAGQNRITEHFVTRLDGDNQAHTLAFRCDVAFQKQDAVQLSEAYTANTDLFFETCRNGETDFVNFFWVERGSRQIVQSRQWISDETGALALRFVK